MTAAEAKELAEKSVKADQVEKILIVIKEAALKGEFEVWYYQPIADITRKNLKERGYKVGAQQFDRNEILTKISWS